MKFRMIHKPSGGSTMMQFKRKLTCIALGGLLAFTFYVTSNTFVSQASAQTEAQRNAMAPKGPRIKYVYALDYPQGKKGEFLLWIENMAKRLQEPGELKGIASYDNFFRASPHYIIEFEFDTLVDAGTYFEREEVRKVFDDIVNRGINIKIQILQLRDDFTPK